MSARGSWIGLALLASLTLTRVLAQAEDPGAADPQTEPQKSGLVEQAERRLIQIDVTVSGPKDTIATLERQDFELLISGDTVDEFTLDNVCQIEEPKPRERAGEEPAEAGAQIAPAAPVPRGRPVSYLFYFDQHHLTPEGRQRSIDMSRELVSELVADGNRASIVTDGKTLETFSEMTEDQQALLTALDKLEGDRTQWDPWVVEENKRISEVLEPLNKGDIDKAKSIARMHMIDERYRTEKALRLFALVLGRLADVDPPKAVIYYADTMRSNAGEHYVSFFGANGGEDRPSAISGALTAAHSFDEVVQAATAMGIRLYTVQAEGLVGDPSAADPNLVVRSARFASAAPTANMSRVKDAQNTLVGLALESGGEAFLNGVRATKIAEEIEQDLSCVYLLSFDASLLPEDRRLPVKVRVLRPKVDVQARGLLVVESESKRLETRLLSAFAAPDNTASGPPLRGAVVPTGFKEGRFQALVQLVLPPSELPTSTWDLGLSLVARDKVREESSGHVQVNRPGVPVIFEKMISFPPGPYDIVAVAHEQTLDQISTDQLEGVWPDPDDAPATIGPIAVLQPWNGAFLREAESRQNGPVAVGARGTLLPDRPTALVSIVCRGKLQKAPMRVERSLGPVPDETGLAGDAPVPFAPQEIDFGEDRCAVIQDVVKSGTMTPGLFRYEVRISQGKGPLATLAREFAVVSANPEENQAVLASPQ